MSEFVRPIVAISFVAGVKEEKLKELEKAGYIVVEVLSVDEIKVLNGPEIEELMPDVSEFGFRGYKAAKALNPDLTPEQYVASLPDDQQQALKTAERIARRRGGILDLTRT